MHRPGSPEAERQGEGRHYSSHPLAKPNSAVARPRSKNSGPARRSTTTGAANQAVVRLIHRCTISPRVVSERDPHGRVDMASFPPPYGSGRRANSHRPAGAAFSSLHCDVVRTLAHRSVGSSTCLVTVRF